MSHTERAWLTKTKFSRGKGICTSVSNELDYTWLGGGGGGMSSHLNLILRFKTWISFKFHTSLSITPYLALQSENSTKKYHSKGTE